jgi:hypothetical protein
MEELPVAHQIIEIPVDREILIGRRIPLFRWRSDTIIGWIILFSCMLLGMLLIHKTRP